MGSTQVPNSSQPTTQVAKQVCKTACFGHWTHYSLRLQQTIISSTTPFIPSYFFSSLLTLALLHGSPNHAPRARSPVIPVPPTLASSPTGTSCPSTYLSGVHSAAEMPGVQVAAPSLSFQLPRAPYSNRCPHPRCEWVSHPPGPLNPQRLDRTPPRYDGKVHGCLPCSLQGSPSLTNPRTDQPSLQDFQGRSWKSLGRMQIDHPKQGRRESQRGATINTNCFPPSIM